MDRSSTPIVRDLVLVGGGHSHVTVLRRFGMQPMAGVRLTLISRDAHAPYSGMLPGLIAGHYEFDDAHIDLGPLAAFAGARFLHDEVVGLDRDSGRVLCRDHPPVSYDVLSINIGSSPRLSDVRGAAEAVVPVKPIDGFAVKWQRVRSRLLDRREPAVVAAVGGGAGGVELLLSVQFHLNEALRAAGDDPTRISYRIYTAGPDILPTHNAGVRRRFRRVMAERGVEVRAGARVVAVEGGTPSRLRLDDGSEEQADEILWVTSASAQTWPAAGGLAVDAGGFIRARETLQTVTDADIFVAGDIASVDAHPRPKAGVFAVRQGPPLEQNLRRRLRGERLRPFRPQKAFLSLVSTGDRYAVASRSFWSFEGRWVWRWKDWIDRRFMEQFNELPTMPAGARPTIDVPADAAALELLATAGMRCAGCGSKVGSDVLSRALDRLQQEGRVEVVDGVEARDDAAVVRPPEGRLLLQTIDGFRALLDDPWTFGRIAANHALGDIWAMGGEPLTALALVTVPLSTEAKMEEEIYQLLAGAGEVFAASGTVLVGGHTTEGAETFLGFAMTGSADPERIGRKRGLQVGDAIIVTEPIGSGVIFAAHMRRLARGRWLEAAIERMVRSQAAASRILVEHGATAMTDVTGFGLLGHLAEMLAASGVSARLDADAVPTLPGAMELVGRGIFSSLQRDNLRIRRVVDDVEAASRHPAYPLLFDPQTAGGLLAGVPPHRAADCVLALRAAGYPAAARIGLVGTATAEGPAVTIAPLTD